MTESPTAVIWPALKPGPAGRVVVVVVVVGGTVDVVVVVASGREAADGRCGCVDVADVSRTANTPPAARSARATSAPAVTLPDGRRHFRELAWRALAQSVAAQAGPQCHPPSAGQDGALWPETYADRLAGCRQQFPVLGPQEGDA